MESIADFFRLNAEAKRSGEILDLGSGEPDFPVPNRIKAACAKAIMENLTGYTEPSGIPELREAIVEYIKNNMGVRYNPSNVIVGAGARSLIFQSMLALLNVGDEVLMPEPYSFMFRDMAKLSKAIAVPLKPGENLRFNFNEFYDKLTNRTKMIVINTPVNPSGVVYSKNELEEIARVCVDKEIYVLSDEIYEKVIFDNKKHVSIASLEERVHGIEDMTIRIAGHTKTYSMAGFRVGYCTAREDIIKTMSEIQTVNTRNAAHFAQIAAIAALKGSQDFVEEMRKECERRRDYFVSEVSKIPNLRVLNPEGGTNVLVDVSSTGKDGRAFREGLLKKYNVNVTPAVEYGASLKGYIRVSLYRSLEEIEEATNRLIIHAHSV